MPRVLITETATYVAGKIIYDPDELNPGINELTIDDILHDMIWHLVRFKRPEDVSINDFIDSFSVIPVVQIITTGRTAADASEAVGRRVKTLANVNTALIERIDSFKYRYYRKHGAKWKHRIHI